MPEISRFYGIVIYMYWKDHLPAHFHAEYGEFSAQINIETFAVLKGNLPPKALSLVVEWAAIHQQELLVNWESTKDIKPFKKIEPLK